MESPGVLVKTESDPLGDDNVSVAESEEGRNASGKVKSTCEQCSLAKVKCSGVVPCARCMKKNLTCEYAMEKKRGRRTATKRKEQTLCSDNSCWGQVILNPISKCDDFGAKFGLDSVERRIFQVFFAIYKHHATPQSCCREWFTWQLNKMSCFLYMRGKFDGSARLDEWMSSKGIPVLSKDAAEYRKIPVSHIEEGTGRRLPPVLAQKGPKFTVSEDVQSLKRKSSFVTGKVYSTGAMYDPNSQNIAIERQISDMKNNCYLYVRSTHECFEVEVNTNFTELFGYTSSALSDILEQLFGGLLPWGSDLVATLIHRDADLLFFIRAVALKFNQVGRPAKFPSIRQVISSHVFEFANRAKDIIECLLTCVHREYLDAERTEVEIFMGFEPTVANVPRLYQGQADSKRSRTLTSTTGEAISEGMTYEDIRSQPGIRAEATSSHVGQNPVPPCQDAPGMTFSYDYNPNTSYLSNMQRGRLQAQENAFGLPQPAPVSNGGGQYDHHQQHSTSNDDAFFFDNILNWADNPDDMLGNDRMFH